MAENLILLTFKEHVGYITLNNPGKGNQLDLPLSQELESACNQVNSREEIYVVIISGAGNSFCRGGDERQLVRLTEDGGFLKHSPADAVAGINVPTLAAIDGNAVGQGLELALACDLRIASVKSRFGLPQITHGWMPLDGGTQRLSRIVGKGKALELVLSGEIIDAQAAFDIGLVNRVVERDKLISTVEDLANTISTKAPWALRYAKEAVNKGSDLTLDQGLRLEADLYFLLHTTTDRTEGIQSFLQKRPPHYKGK